MPPGRSSDSGSGVSESSRSTSPLHARSCSTSATISSSAAGSRGDLDAADQPRGGEQPADAAHARGDRLGRALRRGHDLDRERGRRQAGSTNRVEVLRPHCSALGVEQERLEGDEVGRVRAVRRPDESVVEMHRGLAPHDRDQVVAQQRLPRRRECRIPERGADRRDQLGRECAVPARRVRVVRVVHAVQHSGLGQVDAAYPQREPQPHQPVAAACEPALEAAGGTEGRRLGQDRGHRHGVPRGDPREEVGRIEDDLRSADLVAQRAPPAPVAVDADDGGEREPGSAALGGREPGRDAAGQHHVVGGPRNQPGR